MRKGVINPMASRHLIREGYEFESVLTYAEAARIAGVKVTTLIDWVNRRNLPRMRERGPYKIDRNMLDIFLETGIPQC